MLPDLCFCWQTSQLRAEIVQMRFRWFSEAYFPIICNSVYWMHGCSEAYRYKLIAVSYSTTLSVSISWRYGHTKLPRRTEPWNMVYLKDSQLQLWWGCHHAWTRFINLNLCCIQWHEFRVCRGKGWRGIQSHKFAVWQSSFIVRQPHNSDYHKGYRRKM